MSKSSSNSHARNLNLGTHTVAVLTPNFSYYDSGDGLGYSRHDRIDRSVYAHPPLKSAHQSAAVFFAAIRLTPEQLLADESFRALARKAAEKGKAYTADLLAWEKKDVVAAAVAVVRAEVDAERAEAARLAAIARAAVMAKLEAERPTREAVLAAYAECGYRTCTQGHDTRVVIGSKVGAVADTEKGNQYSSRCTYRRVTSRHDLFVRPDWLARVEEVGGATYDGSLVLDAEVLGVAGYATPVHEIRVVRQTAGTGLKVETLRVTVVEGEWAPLPKRVAATTIQMPAPILADYLEERGVPTDEVMPLRAGYAN